MPGTDDVGVLAVFFSDNGVSQINGCFLLPVKGGK